MGASRKRKFEMNAPSARDISAATPLGSGDVENEITSRRGADSLRRAASRSVRCDGDGPGQFV